MYKFLTIGGLVILLLIPLMMIDGVINERKQYRDSVITEVARSSTGQQKVTGAIVVVPYQEIIIKETVVNENGKEKVTTTESIRQHYRYYLPEEMNIVGHIETEERYRGIYKIPVYLANLSLEGYFTIPKFLDIKDTKNILWQKPYIVFGIEDVRGVNRSVSLQVNKQNIELLPGTETTFIHQGIHGSLTADYSQEQRFEFSMNMALQGMQQLSFLPTGKFTAVSLTSSWPHPSFVGRFLPKTRAVSEQGFTAVWETSLFSSNMEEHLSACVSGRECRSFNGNDFGVFRATPQLRA